MADRLTAEQEREIRACFEVVEPGILPGRYVRLLLAEIAAVRAERDALKPGAYCHNCGDAALTGIGVDEYSKLVEPYIKAKKDAEEQRDTTAKLFAATLRVLRTIGARTDATPMDVLNACQAAILECGVKDGSDVG